MTQTRWQDWLITAIGIGIIATPYVLAATVLDGISLMVQFGFVLTGLFVTIIGTLSLSTGERWEEYLIAIAGLWMMAMPWILSFQTLTWLMGASVISGIALLVLAVLALRVIMFDASA